MPMTPGILIVLFNPSESHMQNVFRIRRLCATVVAVDNSLTLDVLRHERVQAAGIDILQNFNIGGVAGAYNKGLEHLIDKGCQVLFIFDQDSEVSEDYLMRMLDECLTLGCRRF